MTELVFVVTMVRVRDVSMKTTAAAVVTLLRKVAAPLLPKSVWLDPPKAAPISAPLPLWSRTTPIKKRDANM
jgi:hypothetical protein